LGSKHAWNKHASCANPSPRDLGGDPAWFYNDGIKDAKNSRGDYPSAGGLNNIIEGSGNTKLGLDKTFSFTRNLLLTPPLNESLSMMTHRKAKPGSGEVDSTNAVTALMLLHLSGSECRVKCKYVIDGTPEGYGAAAFDLPIVFGGEARNTNASSPFANDPTSFNETYAGRRTFQPGVHYHLIGCLARPF
jgi:hypothetical protein